MSILLEKFPEAARPYCQRELRDMRVDTKHSLRLSDHQAEHPKSRYFYYVKRGGRKEEQLNQQPDKRNVGSCSVCWKLEHTDPELRDYAMDLINNYMYTFEKEPDMLTFDKVMLERFFYTWLYEKK